MDYNNFQISHSGQKIAIANRLLHKFKDEHNEHSLGVVFRTARSNLNAVLPESYHETSLVWMSLNWQKALNGGGEFEGIPEDDHVEVTIKKDDALSKLKAFQSFQRNDFNPTINRLLNERDIAEKECGEDTFHGNPAVADFITNGLPSKNPNANPSTNAAYLQRLIKCNPSMEKEETELISNVKGEIKRQQYRDDYWDAKINLDDFRLTKDMPEPPDPLEDYTTYTEFDTPDRLTVAANTITVDAMQRNEDVYVYADKGIDNFGTTFLHQNDVIVTSHAGGAIMGTWCLANVIDDLHGIDVSNNSAYAVFFNRTLGGANTIVLREIVSGSVFGDTFIGYVLNTRYYFTNSRILGGANGVLKSDIFSDTDRTIVVDNLSLNIIQDNSFRYIYGVQSFNLTIVAPVSGDVRNLDLGEVIISAGRRRRMLIGRN